MKRFFLTIIIIFCIKLSFGQVLIFCESVKDGKPVSSSHIFTISKKGGFFNFYVSLPGEVNSKLIRYDIFKLNEMGKEVFDVTIEQPVEPDWTWFWKEITFYKSGEYTVYVYDEADKLLCTAMVKILIQ